ncbi:MAG: GTPase Era [Gammaproteobacteria bacterium]|nr:GTPase Era [Gammaproteobacteria bacterium]
MNIANKNEYRCGYVSIIGRPNVGKSTLINRILGTHLSITSKKPQTTQHRIQGIKTTDTYQAIYIDTPGLHHDLKSAVHKYMNREASTAIDDVDVVILMLEALKLTDEDQRILKILKNSSAPIILVINKVDLIKNKERLLPYLQSTNELFNFKAVIPLSSKKGSNIEQLEKVIIEQLPVSAPYFSEDQLTDKNDRFLASELIREQLMRLLGNELPYAVAVEVEAFEENKKIIKVSALIWVERDNQKSIVIGQNGEQLKQIGINARQAMQRMFMKKVLLKLWIKVKTGWSNDERALKSLGYVDDDWY